MPMDKIIAINMVAIVLNIVLESVKMHIPIVNTIRENSVAIQGPRLKVKIKEEICIDKIQAHKTIFVVVDLFHRGIFFVCDKWTEATVLVTNIVINNNEPANTALPVVIGTRDITFKSEINPGLARVALSK